ncbi:hypothetical protein HDU78_004915 [Chytriomyces hyalinus]|nr:hypothetical protein HDU78_004915 [Chytriomyces hyalinus]
MLNTTEEVTHILIGTRIESADDGHRGTIRFYGPISGTGSDAEWLGIEWDVPTRGKHSGQHPKDSSKWLFRVAVEGSASFVKAATLNAKILLPQSTFLSALRVKYSNRSSKTRRSDQVEKVKSSGLRTRAVGEEVDVELVGWDKTRKQQSELERISIVGLAGMHIGWLDPALTAISCRTFAPSDQTHGSISAVCPAIEDLDLSRNLFSNWHDIARITMELKKLESLRLNSNRLVLHDMDSNLLSAGFEGLKVLALNSTNTPWSQMEQLAPYLPRLEALYLGFNNMSSFGNYAKYSHTEISTSYKVDDALFPNLETFHVESNKLSSWSEIANVVGTDMPRLKWLNLSDNKLSTISAEACDIAFANLAILNISNNAISKYASVHALNAFPKLIDIRIRNNPVFDSEIPTSLHQAAGLQDTRVNAAESVTSHVSKSDDLIARLGHGTRINGHIVSARDRSDAEMYYLVKVAHWVHALKMSLDAPAATPVIEVASQSSAKSPEAIELLIQEHHPRFQQLVAQYGMPEIAPVSATSAALKDRLRVLQFVLVEVAPEDKGVQTSNVTASAVAQEYLARVSRVKVVEKKVPITMPMRALRALVARVLNVPGRTFRMRGVLGVKKGGDNLMLLDLEEEMRDVAYYDFESGDEIHVLCD